LNSVVKPEATTEFIGQRPACAREFNSCLSVFLLRNFRGAHFHDSGAGDWAQFTAGMPL